MIKSKKASMLEKINEIYGDLAISYDIDWGALAVHELSVIGGNSEVKVRCKGDSRFSIMTNLSEPDKDKYFVRLEATEVESNCTEKSKETNGWYLKGYVNEYFIDINEAIMIIIYVNESGELVIENIPKDKYKEMYSKYRKCSDVVNMLMEEYIE